MPTPAIEFQILVLDDAAAVAKTAAASIEELAKLCVAESGRFNIALSGGATPKAVYTLLADHEKFAAMPWKQTFLFWGDERKVKPNHDDSNYKMVYESLIKGGTIPIENLFPIPTGEPTAAACAEKYEKTLNEKIHRRSGGFPVFDLIMLGLGPDGHTASLFPGTPAPLELARAVTWCDPLAGNPNVTPAVDRITITPPVIWRADNVFILAEGESKKPVLQQLLSSGKIEGGLVARILWKCKGHVRFFIDNAADPRPKK